MARNPIAAPPVYSAQKHFTVGNICGFPNWNTILHSDIVTYDEIERVPQDGARRQLGGLGGGPRLQPHPPGRLHRLGAAPTVPRVHNQTHLLKQK